MVHYQLESLDVYIYIDVYILMCKFTTILWWAWRWRNAVCFGDTNRIPNNKIKFLESQFMLTLKALHVRPVWEREISKTQEEILVS